MKNIRNASAVLGVVVLWVLLTGCKNNKEPETQEIANPASVFCEENWGNSEIVTDREGWQFWICVFENWVSCDEWEYYRGECSPTPVNQENEIQEISNSEDVNLNEAKMKGTENVSELSEIDNDEDR